MQSLYTLHFIKSLYNKYIYIWCIQIMRVNLFNIHFIHFFLIMFQLPRVNSWLIYVKYYCMKKDVIMSTSTQCISIYKLCLLVCLFACVFVSNKRQNGWTDRTQIGTSHSLQGRFMDDQNFNNQHQTKYDFH